VWSYDFVSARTADGAPLRILNIDDFTREAVASHVAHSIGARDIIRVLERVFASRGKPAIIRSDNGRELIAATVADWLADRAVTAAFVAKAARNRTATSNGSTARCATSCSTASCSTLCSKPRGDQQLDRRLQLFPPAPRPGHDDRPHSRPRSERSRWQCLPPSLLDQHQHRLSTRSTSSSLTRSGPNSVGRSTTLTGASRKSGPPIVELGSGGTPRRP
jgi:hypothetical protein